MVFSSISFLFYFLPAFLILYVLSRYRNAFLLFASLFFYAWGEMEYVFLLMASCLANYAIGYLVGSFREKWGRLILAIGIASNLSVLGIYKYLGFMILSINSLPSFLNIPHISEKSVHLPLGISFFTFQAISYLVDVYRDKTLAEKNPINVALYISMFPQLVAGPIVRFSTIAGQIRTRVVTAPGVAEGIKWFVIGLGQKVLIANTVAKVVDGIYQVPSQFLDAGLSWTAAICYSLQIYYDFSGYSHMAIGLGLMMGFSLPENFNFPYISQSITEFWKRWHITLSTWFRDYLYIPLGGNRKGKNRTYFHLILVFFLCGLWHGAGWTFVAWGFFHGGFMVLERMGLNNRLEHLPKIFRHIYCLGVVTIGWVLFRAETFERAGRHLKAMAGFGSGDGIHYPLFEYLQGDVILALIAGMLCSTPIIARIFEWPVNRHFIFKPLHLLVLALIFLSAVMGLAAGAYNPFIYFRF